MSEFKVGDLVKRVRGGDSVGVMTVGNIYEVVEASKASIRVKGNHFTWDNCNFELVRFDMEQPWFIRVGDIAHSHAVQQWLFDQGFTFNGGLVPCDWSYGILTNDNGGKGIYTGTKGIIERKLEQGAKEIKVSTKTVIDNVVYPPVVLETPQQKQIRELEETIRKASEQIEQLKKDM